MTTDHSAPRATDFTAAPALSARSAVAGLLRAARRAFAAAARRRRLAEARAALEAMDDAMLADIGMTRGDIPFRVALGRDRPEPPGDPRG